MRRLLALACLATALAAPSGAWALNTAGLQTKLGREMRLAGARGGAYVEDLDGGRVVFAAGPDVPRPPASVEKLFTTATALLRFGPEATFATEVLATAEPDADGVLRGDLWLRGGGDPTLSASRVGTLAGQLTSAGITSVHGAVAGDGTLFDTLPGSFRTGGAFDRDMGGALGALAVNRGLLGARPQPAPALIAARALARGLRGEGVNIAGRTEVAPAPLAARVVATTSSPPLRAIVTATNVPSDNLYAETLLKNLGARFGGVGTTAAGAAIVRSQLASAGVKPTIVDGSGLASANRTTPRQVVSFLAYMNDQAVAPDFRASLPVAARTGTLRTRMRGTPAAGRCQAKTGTIYAVSALAGYCQTQDGHTLAFAFQMSGMSVGAARRIQDRMTVAIARTTVSVR
jgi:D-alanyl-D-alanine carboxypeptidase/D-alanyl-D-alanine-endopeptidase (penicillin-binding protein 4)